MSEQKAKPKTDAEWLDTIKSLRYPEQVKLAVVIAMLDAQYLPFEQHKDVIRAGLDLYSNVRAIDFVMRILDPGSYREFDGEGFTMEQLQLAAFRLWAEDIAEIIPTKLDQLANMAELAADAKGKTADKCDHQFETWEAWRFGPDSAKQHGFATKIKRCVKCGHTQI